MLENGERPKLPICGFENDKFPKVCCYEYNQTFNSDRGDDSKASSISQISKLFIYNLFQVL